MKFSLEKPKALVVFLDIIFVMLLSMSGSISGVLSTIVYFSAFLVPIIIGFNKTKEKNNTLDFLSEYRIEKSLPMVAPTLALVMLLAFLTSVIITALTGRTNSVDLGESVGLAILSHALLPAVLEEGVFRYIPMRAMKDERPAEVILYTALLFALVHHSFFSLPYAFLAGAAFMLIDLMVGSVWPSVLIHFLNNLLSVLFYFYSDKDGFVPAVIVTLAALLIVSAVFMIRGRSYYGEKFRQLLSYKGIKFQLPAEAWILIIPMLIIAFLELIS